MHMKNSSINFVMCACRPFCGRAQNDFNYRSKRGERVDLKKLAERKRQRNRKTFVNSLESFNSIFSPQCLCFYHVIFIYKAQQPNDNYTPSTLLISFHVALLKCGKLSVELCKSTFYIVHLYMGIIFEELFARISNVHRNGKLLAMYFETCQILSCKSQNWVGNL
jgi:hypothetical protein